MSESVPKSHVRFSLEHPRASLGCRADVPVAPHGSFCSDDPPPWEPRFEDLSTRPFSLPLRSRHPLDPPPPCFSTCSPLRIRSHDFPPFCIPAVSDKLAEGFRLLYPYGILEGHGLSRADWLQFLEDLGVTARLSAKGLSAIRSRGPVAPLPIHCFFPARTLGSVYDRQFARNPVEEVRALIQIWNQSAFERRKIRVTLQVRQCHVSRKNVYVLSVESL